MFHYIAGGALGLNTSMKGGLPVVFLGVFFHYFIAFVFTLIFFLLYPRIKTVLSNKYLAGLLYGVFIWLVMNLVVLPLSRLPESSFTLENAIIGILIIMIMVGLPIAISAYNYCKNKWRV